MAVSEEPPKGGSNSSEAEFLGGFSGDFAVRLPEERRSSWWQGSPIRTSVESTLAELRENGLGGYVSSDAWEPQNLGPPTIAQLQIMLTDAGLLGDDYEPGAYDDKTKTAYTGLLKRANAMGTTWQNALTRMRDNPFRGTGPEKEKALPSVTHPEDLKAIFKSAARKTLGTGIPEDQLQRMVAAYQGMETSYQQTESGTATKPMDPMLFAQQQARAIDPVRADARNVVRVANVISNMLSGQMPSEQQTLPGED